MSSEEWYYLDSFNQVKGPASRERAEGPKS